MSELSNILEAILFAAGEPVPFDRLQRGTGCEPIELAAALDDLEGLYRFERRGIRLVRVNDTAQLVTAAEYAEQVRNALEMRRAPALSQPSLEVLAIIAARREGANYRSLVIRQLCTLLINLTMVNTMICVLVLASGGA